MRRGRAAAEQGTKGVAGACPWHALLNLYCWSGPFAVQDLYPGDVLVAERPPQEGFHRWGGAGAGLRGPTTAAPAGVPTGAPAPFGACRASQGAFSLVFRIFR